MNTDKMDTSAVYTLFEEIKEDVLDIKNKLMETPSAPTTTQAPIDLTAVNAVSEEFRNLTEEVQRPIRHDHRHSIEIRSSKVFLSMVVMGLTILGLSFAIGNQRETISQYRNNDLKYQYVKMQGQTSEDIFLRLDRQFRYRDSVTIIRKQVERYEQLVMEQAERIIQAKREAEEAEKLQQEAEILIRKSK
ncbi:hypothetical protein EZS27_022782 [termite gut metagenome]|uniref:Uncharacterized protein n=2 Tax=termite gut metagenome TaxID=433724 RepID=A0A5J4R2B2_9ZZZZ